jgi:small subunit ribosomal protein S4
MAKNLDSKCKLCRRAGEKLFLKGDRCGTPKCALVKKPYAPGAHGNSGSKRGLSEYGKQLAQKQKIRRIYGISERQLRKHIADAKQDKGVLGDNIIARLEMRMDNVIYRLKLADSRAQARELVAHKHFNLNGRSFNIPSGLVKIGDVINVKDQKIGNKYFKELQAILKKNNEVPQWLSLDPVKMEGKVLGRPTKDEIGVDVDIQGVIEYYSR